MKRFITVAALAAVVALAAAQAPAEKCCASDAQEQNGMPLLFVDDFEQGNMDAWAPTDDKAWKVEEDEGSEVLALVRGSRYEPPVRSPHNIAWVKGLRVTDFVFELRVKQCGREYGHRDLCFFFGQDAARDDEKAPQRYYYVHLATKADDHANSVFLVNDAPRVSIAKERTNGTDWGKGYHTVRIERCTQSGTIKVFFDDMDKPVMTAEDKTFTSGSIGVGSFDDVGVFDDVHIWGALKK